MEIFSVQMEEVGVTCSIDGDERLAFICWRQDIQAIFTNLIDNSLYWLRTGDSPEKRIHIRISSDGGQLLHIDYQDTGPGATAGVKMS